MRVFVTGATGFIGVHLVAALRTRGHEVACLVRSPAKAAAVFGTSPPVLVAGDLADAVAFGRAVAGVDVVVHLAGLTAARSRAELFAVNADGTRAVAATVRNAGSHAPRLVHVSSLAAAGPAFGGRPLAGPEPSAPVSDYGRSKLAGEAAVRELDSPWAILRPPAVYGPHDREFLRLFRLAARGLAPMFGGGTQRLSLVFAPDLADAIVACVERTPPPAVYYPAHADPTTARALVEAIGAALARSVRVLPLPRGIVRPLFAMTGATARLAGRATLLTADKANEILAEAWLCSPAGLERATDWRARTDLARGLAATAAWYRDAGWLRA